LVSPSSYLVATVIKDTQGDQEIRRN